MADFVAVLKKTLGGLADPTPALRQKVYDKARATIDAKLAAINPPPPQAVVDRQKRALEDAIASIEKDYSDHARPKISDDPLQELESVFASIERQKSAPPKLAEPVASRPEPVAKPAPTPAPPAPKPSEPAAKPEFASWLDTAPKVMPGAESAAARPQPPVATAPKTEPAPAAPKPDGTAKPEAPRAEDMRWGEVAGTKPAGPAAESRPELAGDPAKDDFFSEISHHDDDDEDVEEAAHEPQEERRGYGRLAVAAAALIVIAGGGYGVWLNKDSLFGGSDSPAAAVSPKPADDAARKDAAAVAPAAGGDQQAATQPPASGSEPKFTQRLKADGTEIDAGPANGAATIGEGTSVAAATQPPTTTPAAPEQTPPASGNAAAQPGVAIGQRAIFYEERTNVAQGSAEPGNIVWSVVQESPGGDLPPEPAIRAEATIPGKDLQLRMTIRRNADQTLPASHIIEIIFLTPQGFEGGGIENVLRVSMKGSEQEAGSPLIGIPAKIADGFFLIALNDGKPETEANMTLLRRQSWIDVPIVYKSGRRALFTMEKGIPGQKVFDDAIKAWQTASASNAG